MARCCGVTSSCDDDAVLSPSCRRIPGDKLDDALDDALEEELDDALDDALDEEVYDAGDSVEVALGSDVYEAEGETELVGLELYQ